MVPRFFLSRSPHWPCREFLQKTTTIHNSGGESKKIDRLPLNHHRRYIVPKVWFMALLYIYMSTGSPSLLFEQPGCWQSRCLGTCAVWHRLQLHCRVFSGCPSRRFALFVIGLLDHIASILYIRYIYIQIQPALVHSVADSRHFKGLSPWFSI